MTGVATINTTADEVGTPFFIRLLNMGMVAPITNRQTKATYQSK